MTHEPTLHDLYEIRDYDVDARVGMRSTDRAVAPTKVHYPFYLYLYLPLFIIGSVELEESSLYDYRGLM